MNKCELCTNTAQLLCLCSDMVLCSQCVGGHVMNDPGAVHTTQVLGSTLVNEDYSQDTWARVQHLLTEELIGVTEFQDQATSFFQNIFTRLQEQLKNAESNLLHLININCSSLKEQLEQALDEPSTSPLFLSLADFTDTEGLKLVDKNLDFEEFNLEKRLQKALKFQIKLAPVNIRPFRTNPILSSSVHQAKLSSVPASPTRHHSMRFVHRGTPAKGTSNPPSLSRTRARASVEPPTFNFVKRANSSALPYLFVFANEDLVSFDTSTGQSRRTPLPKQEIGVSGCSWAIQGDFLVITGGVSNIPKNSTWLFDIHKREFTIARSMRTSRFDHASVVMDEYVYVLGGCNRVKIKECERFSVVKQTWERTGNLNIARSRHTACVHMGRLFVAGGEDTPSIETFNSVDKCFSFVRVSLPVGRSTLMFPHEDKIMILQPGKASMLLLSSMECVEMGEDITEDYWTGGNSIVTSKCVFLASNQTIYKFDMAECVLCPVMLL